MKCNHSRTAYVGTSVDSVKKKKSTSIKPKKKVVHTYAVQDCMAYVGMTFYKSKLTTLF